ncbi:adenine-specific methyltransferase EcoRI family protein [Microcella sp.]|uniref:adenine-specific methyltransferase EcoRI family protein n=1 Tax=Microcella sp. TaxID=1913979 RepID=UPI00391D55E7
MKKNNASLAAAKTAKKDEFYTQWADIEREMNAYLEFDPDVFRGKSILLPCDDPEWSNFAKFFALHFMSLGLKKLTSTSFAPDSNPAISSSYQPTLFEMDDPQFDASKTRVNGKKFVLEPKDLNGDGVVNIDDLRWQYLEGDGDFRSAEVTALRDEADVVITNPPFSLFKEFVPWLIEGGKQFSIIGHQNAITYKEIFPLIKGNQAWLGRGFKGNAAHFGSPYEDVAVASDRQEGMIRVSGVIWLTNIEHGRRHEPLQLMTMAENLKFSKNAVVRSIGYPQYVNFEAIDVPAALATPSDYDGIMGVPITFLEKYNPDQFEIIGNSDDMDMTLAMGVRPLGHEFIQAYRGRGGTGHYSPGMRMLGLMEPEPRTVYKRILIRRKAAA